MTATTSIATIIKLLIKLIRQSLITYTSIYTNAQKSNVRYNENIFATGIYLCLVTATVTSVRPFHNKISRGRAVDS